MDKKKVMFCIDCTSEHRGFAMSEADALLHKDTYPDHNITPPDESAAIDEAEDALVV